jgi:hypothetical protein
MFFGEKKYSDSLKWINLLLNDVDIDKSEDIHCFAQLLNLIIHLELGNQRLVPYALKSTQRYLTTRNRVYKFETIVMNFINKILKLKEDDDEKVIYRDLMDELKPLQEDPLEKSAFEYLDLSSWVESKISEKSFSEIVKEKAI